MLEVWMKDFAIAGGRYLLIAGAFTALYMQTWWELNYIEYKGPKRKPDNILRIVLSLQSLSIYSLFALVLYFIYLGTGYSPVYYDVHEYGWAYFFLSMLVMAILNDAAFYWTHRVMHWTPVYKKVHALHHRFTDVNAWTTYSFHFFESVIAAILTFYVPALLFPWHPAALMLYSTCNIAWSTYLHCGYDLVPKEWQNRRPFTWFYSSTHHFHHHQNPNCNYGLYFTIWDRMMGTEIRK